MKTTPQPIAPIAKPGTPIKPPGCSLIVHEPVIRRGAFPTGFHANPEIPSHPIPESKGPGLPGA